MFKDVIRDETCSELDNTRKFWEFFQIQDFLLRKKNELWKYTNLNPIEKNSYELDSNDGVSLIQINHKDLPLDDNWNNIIFINGKLSKRFSDFFFEDGLNFYDCQI